jgi:CRISPR-associated protein Cas1
MRKSAYIFTNGDLKRKDNTVSFTNEDGTKYLPIEDIYELYIFGKVTVSKKFMEYACQKEVILHFFNYHEYYIGSFYPREHYNSGYMTIKQSDKYMDINERKKIAYTLIEGSVKNIVQVLKYYKTRGKDSLGLAIKKIEALFSELNKLSDIEVMMAIEGNIRDEYYKNFDIILENEEFSFIKRSRRPPGNKLNTLISFGNSVLYTSVLSEIYNTHLDPRIGFLHTSNNRRFTLNLDIAEVFKPIIIDRIIFNLISKKMITKKHFEKKAPGVFLNDEGRKVFVKEIDDKFKTTINHKKLGRPVSYRRLIRMELYKLEKHIIGEEEYTPFISSW